ncbi:MAG: PQQ-binding-like beta-propeller repeat protein [Pirellulales bacterium]|nr:PQQ-binding-like beta-propeller repeat protein [Pirellulales bacterium]
MLSAERFLSILEEKDLLPPGVLAKLRLQVAQAKNPPKASNVAKALIDKGYLTPVLAKRLLGVEEDGEMATPPKERPAKTPAFSPSPAVMQAIPIIEPAEDEEELGLVPSEKPAEPPPKKKSAARTPASPGREPSPAQIPTAKPVEFVAADDSPSLLEDELTSLEPDAESLASPGKAAFEGIFSGSAMEMAAADGGILATGAKKGLFGFLKRGKKPAKKEDWGSVFMLVGGGGLLLLIFAGVLLTWYLYRKGLEDKYQQAQNYYKAASYEQAIKSFEEFAKAFPNRPEASSARVLIGLAEMRQVEQGEDWVECLKTATAVLERIYQEPNFNEAHGDIAAMLPKIAEGLAARAKEKSSPELVAKTREALELIDRYVPQSLLQLTKTKLADIEASLGLTERQIARDKELEKRIAEIQAAIEEQKTDAAYATRRKLLKTYPDLLDNAKLAAAMLAISKSLHAAVKSVSETKTAVKDELPTPIMATAALAQRNAKTVLEDLQGRVVCVAAEGAAYGIDAAAGKVLWRRFTGYPQSLRTIAPPPKPVNAESGADVLAVDSARNEVLRLEAASGRLVWRFSAGEPFVPQPVLAENRILLAAPSGKLIALDAETGDSSGYAQLPQALQVAPAVDPAKKLIYQIAEHSNLYVLGLDDFSCKQVYLLGHEAGSISSAPAVVSGYLVIGVNDGAQDASLRLFAVERGGADKPGIALKQVQQIPLKGRIDITPAVDGNRVLVATDRGMVRVFDLTPGEKGTQLRDVAETAIEGGENVARYALLQGGQFWIADIRLTKYDVVGSKGRLVPKWIDNEGCAFIQPPVAAGSAVISVHRKPRLPGVFVTAVGVEEPTRSWETILAVPPAGELIESRPNKKLALVTKLGGLFEFEAEKLQGDSMLDAPVVSIDPARLQQPIGALAKLDRGAIALSAARGASQINVFDPGESQLRYRWLALSEKSACSPLQLAGGLLVPTEGGAVFLLDPQSGKPLAAPFQAPLQSGLKLAWQMPAVCGKQEFVIADGKSTLYRIGLVDSPKPHLAALDRAEIASDRESPAAVVGNAVFLAGEGHSLGIFELPKLKRLNEHKLTGRCVWGPAAIENCVLLATDDEQLACFDAKGEKLWQAALAYGPLAGRPLATADGYLLASASGVLWRVDAKTGKEQGKVETGRALATGPALAGDRALVVGTDGSIYEVKQP